MKKLLKFVLSLVFVGVVYSIVSGISSGSDSSYDTDAPLLDSVFAETSGSAVYAGEPLVELPEEALLWSYDRLTPHEQTAYIAIRDTAAAHSVLPVPVNISLDGLDRVLEALDNDHPEIFWFDGELTYYSNESSPDQVTTVELTYTVDKEDIPRIQAQIDTYIAGCMASPDMAAAETDFDKIVAVYRYLVDRTEYDLAYTEEQSVVSLMQEGRAVCRGYAEAFCLIMHRMGYPCTVIAGLSSQDWVLSDDGHAWNAVMLDGQWYNVDVTWGDPVYTDELPEGETRHPNDDFILVNDALFDRDHTDFNELGSPDCTALDQNYHNRYGLLHSEWNEEYFRWALQAQLDLGLEWAQVRYDNYDAYYTAKAALFDNGLLGDLVVELGFGRDEGDYISWTYNYDDITGTVCVQLIY